MHLFRSVNQGLESATPQGGGQAVAGSGGEGRGGEAASVFVSCCKGLLISTMGTNWGLFGQVVKLIKTVAKHEGPSSSLRRQGEASNILLGVARLVSTLGPEHAKLLKRTARALWLLNRNALPFTQGLPDLEPLWSLPSKEAPHLNPLVASPDAEFVRHAELFPEDYEEEDRR